MTGDARVLKIRWGLGLVALFGLIMFLAATTDYWRAPRRTLAEIPDTARQDEAWWRKANAMLPMGTEDREVERRLRKAGFTVAPKNNFAYLVVEDGGCVRWLSTGWTLDGNGRLDRLAPMIRSSCE